MAPQFRTTLSDATTQIRMPLGTRVRVSGYDTPGTVYWYRRNKVTGAVQVCVQFVRISEAEHVTFEGMPGPTYAHVACQAIRRLVGKGAEVSHPSAKGKHVPATYE